MPYINDQDANVFQEAGQQVTLEFTPEESRMLSELAQKVKAIIESAKNRLS
jgi:hypothetical protein